MPHVGEDLLNLGKRCDAVYVCPKVDSIRKGPLVAYAGKDEQGRNYVGDIYFNFRKIEVYPEAVMEFAQVVYLKLVEQNLIDSFDTVCGIPHGGRTFGQMLAFKASKRFAYADKKPKPSEPGKKQEYTWDMSQFDFEQGERIVLAEDVFNNFQNTDNTLEQIGSSGAEIVALVGALNRSPVYETYYRPKNSPWVLPIVTSIREAYPEYRQDDPAVAEDVAAGNVEFAVKKNWVHLTAAMNAVSVPST